MNKLWIEIRAILNELWIYRIEIEILIEFRSMEPIWALQKGQASYANLDLEERNAKRIDTGA